jgi:hypothetical protein
MDVHESWVGSNPQTAIPIPEKSHGIYLSHGRRKRNRLGFPVHQPPDSTA